MGRATGHAVCSKCGQEKPLDAFYKRNDRKSGRTSRCIECIRGGNTCRDCGSPISANATYCLNCRFRGDRNPISGTRRPDHVKRAVSAAQKGVAEQTRGEAHHAWKGDEASPSSGRRRANEMYTKPDRCESCGAKEPLDWHHIDANPLNNERTNLAALCRSCHQDLDGRGDYVRNVMPTLGRQAQL